MLTKWMNGQWKFLSLFIEPDDYGQRKSKKADSESEELLHVVCTLAPVNELDDIQYALVDLDARERIVKS